MQILGINLIVAVALALPLAFEAPEPDVMDRPPRRPGTPLLDRQLLVRALLVAATLTAVALGLFEIDHHRQLNEGEGEQLALATVFLRSCGYAQPLLVVSQLMRSSCGGCRAF